MIKKTLEILLIFLIIQANSQVCTDVNCATCAPATVCKTCKSGYRLNINGNCDLLQNPTCTVTNCLTCPNSASICTKCADNFQFISQTQCRLCDIPNCISCYGPNLCRTCNQNVSLLVPSIYQDLCIVCDTSSTGLTGCLFCKSANSCAQCKDGLSLIYQSNIGICINCLFEYCSSCVRDSSKNVICAKCIDGYSVSSTTGKCYTCKYPCLSCYDTGSNLCKNCTPPFYYGVPYDNGTCISKGIIGCQVVNLTDISKCLKCEAGYTLSSDASKCSFQCPQNCVSCTNSTNCLVCVAGFYSQGGICTLCSTKGCLACSSATVCTTCAIGFFKENGQCKPCQGFCLQCSSQTLCTKLAITKSRVLIVSSSGKAILAVCDTNCARCSPTNPDICLMCADGYYLKTEKCFKCSGLCRQCDSSDAQKCISCYQNNFLTAQSTCVVCDPTCLTCEGSNAPAKCKSCFDGYHLNGTSCIKGCPENCFTCSGAATCTQCIPGYTLFYDYQINTLTCAPCITSCLTCSQGQPATCLSCGNGFYLSGDTCNSCAPNCKTCTAAGCSQCQQGFYLNSEITCSKNCILPCATCKNTNPNSCLDCVAGYKFNSATSTCDPDPFSCGSKCVACPMGYAWMSGTCLQCTLANCQNCNALQLAECYSCQSKFYLNAATKTCAACNASCQTCLSATGCLTCADGYIIKINAVAKSDGFQCVQCEPPCLTCSQYPDKCSSCIDGYDFFGWKCAQKFRFNFNLRLLSTLLEFNKNYIGFIRQLKKAISAATNRAVTINGIREGSVQIDGDAAPTAVSGTTEAANQLQGLKDLVSSGFIYSMPLIESSISVQEGQVPTLTNISDNTTTRIILGVVIPLGILLIIGFIALVVYKIKQHQVQKWDVKDSQSEIVKSASESL